MNKSDKIEMLQFYYSNNCCVTEAIRKFSVKSNIKTKSCMPKNSTVRDLVKKFEEHGSVERIKGSGRPAAEVDMDDFFQIFNRLRETGVLPTTRNLAREMALSNTTVWKFLKFQLRCKPYKELVVQSLSDRSIEQRCAFAEWFISTFFDDNSLQYVLFSDESYFSLSGISNRQNTRHWGPERSDVDAIEKKLFDQKLMVWIGYSKKVRIPVVVVNGTMNEERYREMMNVHVIPHLRSHRLQSRTYFQQDGATPHTSNANIAFLQEKFGGRLISNRTPQPWPANSPDLSPLDFWLWSYLKDKVYASPRPKNLDELKQKIIAAYENIPNYMFNSSIDSVISRCYLCMMNGGKHFETTL